MNQRMGRLAVGAGIVALLAPVWAGAPAQAAVTNAVPFSQANFHGYATGSEAHLGGLIVSGATPGSGTTLADIDQGFSGASTNTAGLTSTINSETTEVVQPAESASVKAYGTGSGIEVGLGVQGLPSVDANQIKIAGKAEQTAPPNSAEVTKQIGPISAEPVLDASLLTGHAAALYDPTQCPIGQPISYGQGDAANVNALTLVANQPTLNTAGTGTSTAQSQSDTFLSSNGDGTFGLTSEASEIVAPVTVNILNLFTLQVTIAGKNPNSPITLDATTTGEGTGGAVTLKNAGLLTVTLTPVGGTPVTIEQVDLSNPQTGGFQNGFLHVPLSTSALSGDLTQLSDAIAAVLAGNPVTGPLAPVFGPGGALNGLGGTAGATASQIASQLANLSLGYLDIDAVPHAIGSPPNGTQGPPPSVVGGTAASGAIDLVDLNVQLSGSVLSFQLPSQISSIDLAHLYIGHLETSANLTAPISCGIPVIKSANPTSVTAGQPFTYTIQVPDPAKIALIDCDLTNMTVTDVISDAQNKPTFKVDSAQIGTTAGTITQTSPNSATITWTGLDWKAAAPGATPTPPLTFTINVTVPSDSPAGIIQDTVNATATAANCNGGVTGEENVGNVNGTVLTGEFTLQQPSVTAAGTVAAASGPPSLPYTGGPGGLWQPLAGLAVLAAGAASLEAVRRLRRRSGRRSL